MKNVFFINPNPNKTNPRGIRVNNILQRIKSVDPENRYQLLTLSDKFGNDNDENNTVNSFNFLYLITRYSGLFKIGRSVFKLARILDPFVFIHLIIKLDIQRRLKGLDAGKCIFVVIVSPFSNYLLVPWLRKKYPKAKIICDIGDPLYKNSARERDERLTKSIEEDALTQLDMLIVTNEGTALLMQEEYGIAKKAISIIPQGVNTNLIANAQDKGIKEETGTLVYAGSFYENLRSPEALFSFMKSQEYFKLHVYGSQKGVGCEQIVFEGNRDQKSLFDEIQSKEILVYIDNKFGVQTSGKIYEVLSFRKPILFIVGQENSPPYILAKRYPNVYFTENTSEAIGKTLNHIRNVQNISFLENDNLHSWEVRAKDYYNVIIS